MRDMPPLKRRQAARSLGIQVTELKLKLLTSYKYLVCKKGISKTNPHTVRWYPYLAQRSRSFSVDTLNYMRFLYHSEIPENHVRSSDAMSVRILASVVVVQQPREIFTSLSIRHSSPLYFDRTTCRRCRYLDQRRTQGIHE